MSTPDQLPPELRHVTTSSSEWREPVSTRFFGSRRTHRTVAWVVISALWLVPLGLTLLALLRDLAGG